ncbi:MAG: hypothetical protein GXO99_03120 [Nitrospirae bacterium]|nr:hypothetical protein [Nitrospirota bacterium]
MRSKVLFVTKGSDEEYREGFTYASGLAKIAEGGVHVLFVFDRNGLERFEDEMAAVAFAEVGDIDTARELYTEAEREIQLEADRKIELLKNLNESSSLEIQYSVSTEDVVTAIRNVLQNKPAIEIVVISPSLMEKEKSISFKKLRRRITRPVVTMSKPARA